MDFQNLIVLCNMYTKICHFYSAGIRSKKKTKKFAINNGMMINKPVDINTN